MKKRYYYTAAFINIFFIFIQSVVAQVKTVSEDREWANQNATLKNSIEAEYIIRIGDVDNLNFGWRWLVLRWGLRCFCCRFGWLDSFKILSKKKS